MADNLRDRIAAAIYNASDEYARKLMVRPDCPGASEMDGDGKPVCYELADAVIAALGLRPEKGQRSNPTGPLWGGGNRYNVTRYVTEWTTDE